MPVAVGDVLKITAEFTAGRQDTIVQNVYHFKVDDVADGEFSSVHKDLCAQVRAMMVTVEDFFNTQFVLRKFRSIDLAQTIFLGESVPVAWAGADISNDDVAAQVAVEVLARSLKLGHVGRKYLGPTAELTWQDGVLTGPAEASFENFKDMYEAGFVGSVTLNNYTPGTWNPLMLPTFQPFVVGRGTVVHTARTMRSRIPGRGLG